MKDKFIKEWITRAEKEETDSTFQFVSYYIAFNHLYDGYAFYNGYRNISEIDRVKRYMSYIIERYDYEPFGVLDQASEILKGVKSELKQVRTSKRKLQDRDIEELFTSLYYVRCNLFHGSKSMDNERSKGLISDCCKILRLLFETIVI